MALPREWAHEVGTVPALVPQREMVIQAHKGTIDRKTCRDAFVAPRMVGRHLGWPLAAGSLSGLPNDTPWAPELVSEGGHPLLCL